MLAVWGVATTISFSYKGPRLPQVRRIDGRPAGISKHCARQRAELLKGGCHLGQLSLLGQRQAHELGRNLAVRPRTRTASHDAACSRDLKLGVTFSECPPLMPRFTLRASSSSPLRPTQNPRTTLQAHFRANIQPARLSPHPRARLHQCPQILYRDQLALPPVPPQDGSLYVRSSNVQRTIGTAAGVLTGAQNPGKSGCYL